MRKVTPSQFVMAASVLSSRTLEIPKELIRCRNACVNVNDQGNNVEITLVMDEEFDMVACNNEHNG